ncbi:TPA: hypothetical protein QDZ66_002645 [Pluralibacter gergoviae]|uniref:Uncharacterized protein n=1 Tax=Pluralibacter gergoviae TaxID=61647 RepID=A0A089R6K0_PLUGE|nr:hypothetical protein [Pluralibacter gergoviae]AIR02225.1 hypothetical protein LG71_20990 [Pluralibacter gergoviae]EKW6618135.1 hypothetical protein [Pluralibacter gergoviae]EKZ9513347.1 hypothetical protein [Pluralibacter gergoviae]ELC3015443.1 hypothetical protein [Pluralibacter gergoviae]ELC3020422.1 hypothetical protein [Pluralibacter gergoviae]
MQKKSVIKVLHRMLTVILLLLVGGYCSYQYVLSIPSSDVLVSKQKLSDSVWLYVTQYDGGNATVADAYRFYLDKDDGIEDVMAALKKRTPFMVANTKNVSATAYGNTVNIKITGKIYSFTNSDLFYSDGVAIMPAINLIANGIRD